VVAAMAAPEKARPAVTGAANRAFQNNLDIDMFLTPLKEDNFVNQGNILTLGTERRQTL
jgi:hypothetical protein